jgi:hypothetical protein
VGLHFCIIADCSGSMKGAPLAQVKQEMIKTLASLPAHASFFVFFFNTQAMPMPAKGWVPGGQRNVEAIVPWIMSVSPAGNTQPVPAFAAALKLDPRPDVIFFMTDGLLPLVVPDQLRLLNQQGRRVPINAILFSKGVPHGAAVTQMQRIALESGGAFNVAGR